MNLSGYRLHQLTGHRQGEWLTRVSGNWRIVFRFKNGETVAVDFVDYHKRGNYLADTNSIINASVREDACMVRHPVHPGAILRDRCMDGLMTVSEAVTKLGVTRHTLSGVLNGRSGISPEMALNLEALGWLNAAFWMRLQSHYDLVQVRKRLEAKTRAA